MKIHSFAFNPFQENTYLIFDETKECVIIDPGCYEEHEKKELLDFVSENQLKVVKVVNTHGHVDHVLGNDWAKNTFKVPFGIYKGDEETLRSVITYAASYGFPAYSEAEVDFYIELDKGLSFGSTKLEVLFVPGHAPGHIAFYHPSTNQLIAGDVLFRQSIGRTDLPGGDYDTLIETIKSKLFVLPEQTEVYPGHGPSTTIGFEKQNNPFLQ